MPIRCYFLPGLGGSEMGTSQTSTNDTWVSYTALAEGLEGRLRLGVNGISPGPPDGVPMFVGNPLDDYYGRAIAKLRQDLLFSGYVVVPWAFDWRIDADNLGSSLALDIELNESPANPCTIVAHSYGGLVARLAWFHLGTGGNQNLVRRIITLGTPHWGSYGAVRVWSGDADQLDQLTYLSAASLAIYGLAGAFAMGRFWPTQRLIALVNTFPSLYWTLPSLLAPDVAADPNRSAIYNFGWPSSLGISANWLAQAQNAWQLTLANAETQPPSWVMTTVAGQGMPTAYQLAHPQILGNKAAYALGDVGDGTVATSSALLAGSAQYTINAAHMDIPYFAAQSGMLAEWVLDPRSPPSPTPPPVFVGNQLGSVSAGPPSPLPIVGAPPIPRDP